MSVIKFAGDFETNNHIEDCRVWAYSLSEIGNPTNFIYGNSIDKFFEFCSDKNNNYVIYFQNLKFDGEFIFSYLLNNGFTCIEDKKDRADKTFTCLISGLGQFYSIEVYFTVNKKKVNKVTFYDSLKILNFSVEKIAKDFNLPLRKLTLDYNKVREIGHELTQDEVEYIKNDVVIMAMALDIMFKNGLNKMTIGADALSDYKDLCYGFNKYYPTLDINIHSQIKESYKGGFTYLNPLYKNKETGAGIVFDKNSMYPAKMVNELLPYGEPVYFEGKYEADSRYKLYIQVIHVIFDIKKGKIPSIQIKNDLRFKPNEYIESTDGEIVTLVLTNVDLELFLTQYDVTYIKYDGGFKFKGVKGLFNNYIDKWTNEKIKAKKEGNGAMYRISKLMLNSLYGKFGVNTLVTGKYPTLDEDGVIRYKRYDDKTRDSLYVATASFITSYARADIILSSQAIRDYSLEKYGVDYYIYSDTDSIHCLFTNSDELKGILDIDDYRLGAWKLESTFKKGKYIRQKCYLEIDDEDNKNVTVAGLPKKLSDKVTLENFKTGAKYYGKLVPTHVKGGIVLLETTFEIKEEFRSIF